MLSKCALLQRAAARLNLKSFSNVGEPAVGLADSNQAIGVRIGERIEKGSFQQTEDRCVSADAKSKHEDNEYGDSEVSPREAGRVANVLPERFQRMRFPHGNSLPQWELLYRLLASFLFFALRRLRAT